MRTLEMKVDALMRLCTAEEEGDRDRIRTEVRELLKNQRKYCPIPDPEYLIRELLLELGAPDHLVGHPYTIQAVLLVIQNRAYIDNITIWLYPQLAVIFDTTPSRVERAIRNLVDVTWSRGDLEVLRYYFGNTIHPDRGKPTNGEFLARLTSIIKQRLREAA